MTVSLGESWDLDARRTVAGQPVKGGARRIRRQWLTAAPEAGETSSGRRAAPVGVLVPAGLAAHALHLAPAALHQLDGRQQSLFEPRQIHFGVGSALLTGLVHGLASFSSIETVTR